MEATTNTEQANKTHTLKVKTFWEDKQSSKLVHSSVHHNLQADKEAADFYENKEK